MWAETRPHEAGFGSNRVSQARGEYVPAPCTHRPSKHPSEVRMRPGLPGRIWASQGGLSRNKVAVGESAAGSPPQIETRATPWLTFRSVPDADRAPTNCRGSSSPARGWAHSSAVECLLCKEDALGSNPSGSMSSGVIANRVPYTADGDTMNPDARPMHHSARAGMGRVEHARVTPT